MGSTLGECSMCFVFHNLTSDESVSKYVSFSDSLWFFLQVSDAYLKFIKGSWVEMLLEYVKDRKPKVGTSLKLDLSSS